MIEIFILDKGIKSINVSELPLHKGKRMWIHLHKPDEANTDTLKAMSIHSTSREDLRHQLQRSKLETFPNYIYFVAYTVGTKGEKIEADFVLGKNFLITSVFEDLPGFRAFFVYKRKLEKFLKLGPDFLMHTLLDKLIDAYFPYVEDIDERLDDIEERIFGKKENGIINDLYHIRREVLRLRRTVMIQQQKIAVLALQKSAFISEGARGYFRDIYDHSARISEAVDGFRDLIDSTQVTHSSITSNRTNEIIKVLTIMSATMLPLTLLTGWYGMNFTNLPGLADPGGYWHAILAGIAIVGILLFYYKKKGWF